MFILNVFVVVVLSVFFVCLFVAVVFEMQFCYIAWACSELTIFLPQPFEGWNNRHALPYPAYP